MTWFRSKLTAELRPGVAALAPEALALINELTEFATQPKFVYQHVWRVHDLLLWDNRATMHRGRSYESHLYTRDLRRVTVQGSTSTVNEAV